MFQNDIQLRYSILEVNPHEVNPQEFTSCLGSWPLKHCAMCPHITYKTVWCDWCESINSFIQTSNLSRTLNGSANSCQAIYLFDGVVWTFWKFSISFCIA